MNKSLVWLASFPKSGNTWLRIFLSNYLVNDTAPVSPNDITRIAHGDSNAALYRRILPDLDRRSEIEILRARGALLATIAGNGAGINLIKTHNVNGRHLGMPLIPRHLTKSAIYIVRNPLDVTLSYARHFGIDPEQAARSMASAGNRTKADSDSVPQYLGSWAENVRSWACHPPFPVCVLKYEDMLLDPEASFATALTHLGVPVDNERLVRAIEHSRFERVAQQEAEQGFLERPSRAERFFAVGKSRQWDGVLPGKLVDTIRRHHAEVMGALGY